MNGLPLEIIVQILEHSDLPLLQLIRLRRVSKLFRFVIDEFMIVELALFVNMHSSSDLWTRNNQPLSQKSIVMVGSSKRLFDKNFNHLFRNLRRLFLAINSKGLFQIDLPKLQHCEIRRFRGDAGQFIELNKSTASLPKSPAGYPAFEIRSGRLESFHANLLNDDIKLHASADLAWLSFDLCSQFRPMLLLSKSIRILRCLLFDKWTKTLHSLEQLYIGHCRMRSGKILRYFPRLKLLHIADGHKSFLRSIEQERQDLKSGCRLFYAGCAEFDAALLDQARAGLRILTSDYLAACYSKYPSKVCPLFPFAMRFELDRRYLAVWREDRTFQLRFAAGVRVLQIRPHLLPQQTVTELIGHFPQTIYLLIAENTFSQSFFDFLPLAFAGLRSLQIDNTHLSLDLAFLLAFARLYRVRLYRTVHLNLNDQLLMHKINQRRQKLKYGRFTYELEKSVCISLRDYF